MKVDKASRALYCNLCDPQDWIALDCGELTSLCAILPSVPPLPGIPTTCAKVC